MPAKNDNPFKERSLNANNLTAKPLENFYATAEGFGKHTVPKNKADLKPAAKENFEIKPTQVEIKLPLTEGTKQPTSHRSKGSSSREFLQSEINAIKKGPIGPHSLKNARQAAQNRTLDDPEMIIDIQEIDQVSQEGHETAGADSQPK